MNDDRFLDDILSTCQHWDGKIAEKVAGQTQEALNWRPNSDVWSVAQQLDHLIKGNRLYVEALRAVVSQATPFSKPYRPSIVGKLMFAAVRPSKSSLVPVPKPMVPSVHEFSKSVLEEYLDVEAAFRDVVNAYRGKELNGRFVSPLSKFVRIKVGDAMQIIRLHNERHLSKALDLMSDSQFGQS